MRPNEGRPKALLSEELVQIQEARSRAEEVAQSIEERVCAALRNQVPTVPEQETNLRKSKLVHLSR